MYTATFILAIVIYTTGIFLTLQSFSMYTDTSYDTFYTWHFPLLSPLLLTWHPPVVTGIVHLSPRLLVNYPLCPPLLPCTFPPQIPKPPGFPGPNVLLIRRITTLFPAYSTVPLAMRHLLFAYYMYLQISALDDKSWGFFF